MTQSNFSVGSHPAGDAEDFFSRNFPVSGAKIAKQWLKKSIQFVRMLVFWGS